MAASTDLATIGEKVSSLTKTKLTLDRACRIDRPAHLIRPLHGPLGLLWVQRVSTPIRSTSPLLIRSAAGSIPRSGYTEAQRSRSDDYTIGDRYTGLLDGLPLESWLVPLRPTATSQADTPIDQVHLPSGRIRSRLRWVPTNDRVVFLCPRYPPIVRRYSRVAIHLAS